MGALGVGGEGVPPLPGGGLDQGAGCAPHSVFFLVPKTAVLIA